MICITYQKSLKNGLTFASFFYLDPGRTNPSFTPTSRNLFDQAFRLSALPMLRRLNGYGRLLLISEEMLVSA
jgi:hypothetical protein